MSNGLRMLGKVAVCLLVALACVLDAVASQASNLYKQGRKAERSGEMALAYLLYSRAAALAPDKTAYWLKSQAVRTRAALQSKTVPPISTLDSEIEAAADETPEPVTSQDLREARKPLPPAELKAAPGRKNFDLKAPPKALFEEIARAF